jgi:hypothetical protein
MDRDDAEAIEVFLRREDAEDALVVLLRASRRRNLISASSRLRSTSRQISAS